MILIEDIMAYIKLQYSVTHDNITLLTLYMLNLSAEQINVSDMVQVVEILPLVRQAEQCNTLQYNTINSLHAIFSEHINVSDVVQVVEILPLVGQELAYST